MNQTTHYRVLVKFEFGGDYTNVLLTDDYNSAWRRYNELSKDSQYVEVLLVEQLQPRVANWKKPKKPKKYTAESITAESITEYEPNWRAIHGDDNTPF